jgi:hypothetical protein|nr:MAG TPA: hypothetical protein [Caudoviricetes sp.]
MNANIEMIARRAALVAAIGQINNKIENFEIDPDDYENDYKDLLDEGGAVMVGGCEFFPSRILRELDPIAYRCGLNDYIDNIDPSDDANYCDLCDELADLEAELEEVEEALRNN